MRMFKLYSYELASLDLNWGKKISKFHQIRDSCLRLIKEERLFIGSVIRDDGNRFSIVRGDTAEVFLMLNCSETETSSTFVFLYLQY